MKSSVTLIVAALFLTIPYIADAAPKEKMHLTGMFGGTYYSVKSDNLSGPGMGFEFDYQLSDQISLDGRLLYSSLGGNKYQYLFFGGARYQFLNVDFFMTPSVDLHGGVLLPSKEPGKTKQVAFGLIGAGGMLLYKTRWGIAIGPEITVNAVFQGDITAYWLSYSGIVRYSF